MIRSETFISKEFCSGEGCPEVPGGCPKVPTVPEETSQDLNESSGASGHPVGSPDTQNLIGDPVDSTSDVVQHSVIVTGSSVVSFTLNRSICMFCSNRNITIFNTNLK